MGKEISAKEYFILHRPESGTARMTYTRISRALEMFCDVSMDTLCKMPEKELKQVRRIGVKAQSVITNECQKYLEEHQ